MARLLWLLMMTALIAALLAGASFGIAYVRVGQLLGSPPPEMGTQHVRFLWDGMPRVRGRPRAWRFAFGPTRLAGAPEVRIYVSPWGEVLQTDPANLSDLLFAFHRPAY